MQVRDYYSAAFTHSSFTPTIIMLHTPTSKSNMNSTQSSHPSFFTIQLASPTKTQTILGLVQQLRSNGIHKTPRSNSQVFLINILNCQYRHHLNEVTTSTLYLLGNYLTTVQESIKFSPVQSLDVAVRW